MQNDWLSSVQQATEFGNDLCCNISNRLLKMTSAIKLTLGILMRAVDVVAADYDHR